ncbi:MAG: ANTAR domain-containing protein [Actinomycetota bacterium]|nr:ANTAR domain-containing protein [Actinomycetota bacterium]
MTPSAERWLRLATALTAADGVELTVAGMCVAGADVLLVAGASIVLMGIGGETGSTYASASGVEALEELQFTLGLGPGADAYRWGVPVIETRLVVAAPLRWTGFVGPALEAGMGAVFSFPLQVGAARIGAFTLYQDRPGPLGDELYADAVVLAGIVTGAVLAMQAGASDGGLASGLANGGVYHAEVHQASGIVSVQLDIGVGEALVRLRARAFAEGRTVAEVAVDIVSRHLHLDPWASRTPRGPTNRPV